MSFLVAVAVVPPTAVVAMQSNCWVLSCADMHWQDDENYRHADSDKPIMPYLPVDDVLWFGCHDSRLASSIANAVDSHCNVDVSAEVFSATVSIPIFLYLIVMRAV